MNRTCMWLLGYLGVALLGAPLGYAAEIQLPANQRFAAEKTSETPDFQRHVVPLLGRLGCNSRSCHGSFQGRGGLRLSLFGYDFKMDHSALTSKSSNGNQNRIDRDKPDQSLIIQKPSFQIDHEGGERFRVDSWEHHLFRRWIESGARGVDQPRELSHLEIEPSEVVFDRRSAPVQLKVIAVWNNDDREDVTPLCRFRTNNDAIVTVDDNGVLTSTGRGDTHVIAFYDNGVRAVPVMRPISSDGTPQQQEKSATTPIDRFILAKLDKLGITASKLCTDAEFLRRASIDITGTLPTPQEVDDFLSDNSPEKRTRKIEELLDRTAYAAWWANKLCDFTGCNPSQQAELGQETSVQWYMWIYARLQDNLPYDELVGRIVLSTSRGESQTYNDYARQMSSYFRDENPDDFSQRPTMPHYWTRRSMEEPEQAAQAFAHNFLGIRLQCAQCHKHPFAPWTQHDFQEFSRFFESIEFGVRPEERETYQQMARKVGLNVRGDNGSPIRNDVLRHAKEGRTIPWRELYISERTEPESLSLLRSGQVQLGPNNDPREPIMEWMTAPDNPWFARAFVNRVWAGYFHKGIIDPPDDLTPANPPSHPKLLDWLTSEFIHHDYDMRWLHREIVSSEAYQRSWNPSENNHHDRHNFSRMIPRRLPAEVVYDSIKQTLASDENLDEVRNDLTRRAIGHLSMRLAGTYAMQVFGKPDRAVNCDCERDNQPTLLQSVFLQNDPLVEQRLDNSDWLVEIAERESSNSTPVSTQELVRQAWMRALNRPPTNAETKRALKHIQTTGAVTEGLRDLLWALINTKEFVLIH
ncbi:MAG: DUF1553 domain-containing protein [Planctomycetaceae bacterium]|nr:DUF1553 domain-containing protein [Planctomycetaceae bacterium]